MTSRTHDIIAFASLATVAATNPPHSLNVFTLFVVIIGNIVGALVPDLDQATNRLWDLLPAGNFVGNILRHLMLQHRTISHSILGAFIFYKLLQFVLPKIFNPSFVNLHIAVIAIMIGFISHLAADMVTKEGIPLFFPFPFKIGFPPIEALRITTGKFVEKFIVFPGVLVYLGWFVIHKKEAFLFLIKLIRN
jgi:inner membrane protein